MARDFGGLESGAARAAIEAAAHVQHRQQGQPDAGFARRLDQGAIQNNTTPLIHGAEGRMMYARVDKLQRDAMVWTHLAGDTVQRMKTYARSAFTSRR